MGHDWPCCEVLAAKAEGESHLPCHERTLPIELTFSKLVKLKGFRLDRNLRFKFPNLRELLRFELAEDYDHEIWSRDFARILRTSPLLKKMELKLYDRESVHNDWIMALRGLRDLEELDLDNSASPDVILLLLLPKGSEDRTGQPRIDFPLPKLQRIALTGWLPDAKELINILAMRLRLKEGASLLEAREWALHRLGSVAPHKQSTDSIPEQQNHAGPKQPHRTAKRLEEAPTSKVENPKRWHSLETIELGQLRSLPGQYESLLRETVPNVVLK